MNLYRLHSAPVVVSRDEAQAIGCDIFVRARDTKAWIVSLDDGPHRVQLQRIQRSPLVPSYVAETATGHQVYFAAKQPRAEAYDAIVLELLAPFFGATGITLDGFARKPGYRVSKIWSHNVSYTERQIVSAFPRKRPAARHVPTSTASLMPSTLDEQLVISGMLHGAHDLLPFVETDDFVGPSRALFVAARCVQASGTRIDAAALYADLRRQDAIAGRTYETHSLASIAAIVPAPTDLVLDAAFRLAAARAARETVLRVDARLEREQAEIDALALREVA